MGGGEGGGGLPSELMRLGGEKWVWGGGLPSELLRLGGGRSGYVGGGGLGISFFLPGKE